MPVSGVNHINIRTTDIAASAKFYTEVFDLEFRQGGEIMGNRQSWLFDTNGHDVIHLRQFAADSTSTGPIDHIALDCDGKDEIFARLDARGIKYAEVKDLLPGITQVFLHDPHGIPLELYFRG